MSSAGTLRAAWGWAPVILALLLPAPPLAGQARPTNPPEITRLDFQGNESFSDGSLARAIVTRQTECRSFLYQPLCWAGSEWAQDPAYLDRRTLGRDRVRIQLFYYQRGFREASVDTAVAGGSESDVRVTFLVDEGRPVRVDSLAVLGLEELADSGAVLDLPLEKGDPLSSVLMDATRDTLRTRLRNRGYAHADVLRSYFVPRDDPYAARVTFDAYTGPRARIGPLTVTGNQEVSSSVVRRLVPFQEGDLYRQDLIYDAQRSLYNLDIFRHAEIRADLEHLPDSVVPLQVQVNEADVHRVRTGVGWNNGDCVNAESRWASRNFGGGARRLQLRGRLSNIFAPSLHRTVCNESGAGEFGELNWLLAADFSQPWVFSARNSLNTGIFAERQSLKDVFVREAVGLNVALTRSLGGNTSISLGFRPELSSLTAAEIFFCTSFLICDPDDIDVLESPNWLSPVILSFSRDRSNGVLNPTRGYTVQVELEHSSELTGADFGYNRAVAEANWYTEVTERWVTAARVRGGWISPQDFGDLLGDDGGVAVVHPQKRFFAGGSNSVRGFAQNQLGPRVLSIPLQSLLRDGQDGAACTAAEVQELSCDAGALADGRFTPRPIGGSQLLEANVEFRFPLGGARSEGAVFLDVGQLWPEPGDVRLDDFQMTPGLGVRYATPIGPVRVDVGYRLRSGEQLRVVTSQVRPFDPARDDEDDRLRGPDGERIEYVSADELALLEPRVTFEDDAPWSLGRFQLHFSIGQAF